jgi:hypothetical protein
VIEHNLEVIKTADWIIDLGPEGGGEIVAAGPPEAVVKEKRSYTGAFLKPVLARRGGWSGSGGRSGGVILPRVVPITCSIKCTKYCANKKTCQSDHVVIFHSNAIFSLHDKCYKDGYHRQDKRQHSS